MATKPSRNWCITLMHRGKETLIADIPTTHISEERIKALMQMVYAKYSLTDEEIACCHLRGNVKRHRNLLKIVEYREEDPIKFMLAYGSTWVHAIVVRPGDKHPVTGEVMP